MPTSYLISAQSPPPHLLLSLAPAKEKSSTNSNQSPPHGHWQVKQCVLLLSRYVTIPHVEALHALQTSHLTFVCTAMGCIKQVGSGICHNDCREQTDTPGGDQSRKKEFKRATMPTRGNVCDFVMLQRWDCLGDSISTHA